MDYFRLLVKNLEILKSDRDNVLIEIVILDKKNNRHLLAEFKEDEEEGGYLFKNYYTDLDKDLYDVINIEDFGNLFHLMCYVVNNFILPEDEQLAFPENIEGIDLDTLPEEEKDDSFIRDISDTNFDDIKKFLEDD
jgi:hypothetical protein